MLCCRRAAPFNLSLEPGVSASLFHQKLYENFINSAAQSYFDIYVGNPGIDSQLVERASFSRAQAGKPKSSPLWTKLANRTGALVCGGWQNTYGSGSSTRSLAPTIALFTSPPVSVSGAMKSRNRGCWWFLRFVVHSRSVHEEEGEGKMWAGEGGRS